MFITIAEYPNYSINEFGEVKSIYVSKKLKPRTAGRGYYCYQLRNENGVKNEYIHRLVAKTFIPNPENLPQVDHIDGDKSNNHVSNLRWVSGYDNIHAYGFDGHDERAILFTGKKVVAVNGNIRLSFDTKSALLRYFGYENVRTRVKIGEKYNYGKMKGFTVYLV